MTEGHLRFIPETSLRVLIAEDDKDHANLIALYLENSAVQKFEVEIVHNLKQTLEKVMSDYFDIILLDLSLPESEGLNTFFTLHAKANGVPIVVLSGTTDEYIAIEAVRGGAQDYLVKGNVDHHIVIRSIRYAIERKRAEDALRQSEEHFRILIENASDLIVLVDADGEITYASPSNQRILGYSSDHLLRKKFIQFIHAPDVNMIRSILERALSDPEFHTTAEFKMHHKDGSWRVLEGYFKSMMDREETLQVAINSRDITERVQKEHELADAYNATLEGWSRALELRDKETDGHSKRVTELAVKLAKAMGMPDDEIVHLIRGSLLHDMGKMGIPDRILQKESELSEEEWEVMRKHPLYAHEMLYPIEHLRPALHIPYCHHEKWDGTGYPRGLKGEEIPLAARIFAIADVWDAVISNRPYSKAWPVEKAKEYIENESGKHFDPKIVKVFLSSIV